MPTSSARWVGWSARGLAHERLVRQRFVILAIVLAIVITVIALGVLIVFA
jgi:hypothetical protein